jgi:hypothetical protein
MRSQDTPSFHNAVEICTYKCDHTSLTLLQILVPKLREDSMENNVKHYELQSTQPYKQKNKTNETINQ